jgi:CheY-like chemotaxis protein
VLICDDSLITRKMIRRSLEQQKIGCHYDQAGDGVELLSIICPAAGREQEESSGEGRRGSRSKQAPPPTHPPRHPGKYKVQPDPAILKTYDVIIVDKSMPLLNGDVATARLRECGYDGVVLGLTGNALVEDLKSFCDMGANFAFSKPLNMDKFKQVLEEYCVS